MKRSKYVLLTAVICLLVFSVGSVSAKNNKHNRRHRLGVNITDPILTDAGYVAGTMIGDIGDEVRVYRGIPYAAPPLGDLRWKPPQPVEPWEGIRECTKFGPWAAQEFPSTIIYEQMTEEGMGEDCLYLNVLTPAKKVKERLPVLVWLHGGGLRILSGNMPTYNTAQLPQHGAVVVTISHRLGPLGYMAHPLLSDESPDGVSGNYGQLDLIAALEWVQRNIAAFGGDPDRVVIFGQSGGGRKVNWLMASPIVPDDLFHGAICLSGSIHSIPLAEAEAAGEALAAQLEAGSLEELRSKTWQEIITAGLDIGFDANLVEDGFSLLEAIPDSFRAGRQKDVPYIMGMVRTENDGAFYRPVDLVPEIEQLNSNIYAFLWTAVPAGWKASGATGWHGLDVRYWFGDLEDNFKVNPYYFGYYVASQCPDCDLIDPGITDDDIWLADVAKSILVSFAENGNPSVKGLVRWPAYKPYTDRYLEIDIPLEVKSGFSELVNE